MPAGRSCSQRAVANGPIATAPTYCAWLLSDRAVIHLDVRKARIAAIVAAGSSSISQ